MRCLVLLLSIMVLATMTVTTVTASCADAEACGARLDQKWFSEEEEEGEATVPV